jgi:hypothetical protein
VGGDAFGADAAMMEAGSDFSGAEQRAIEADGAKTDPVGEVSGAGPTSTGAVGACSQEACGLDLPGLLLV